jgi:flagellar basal body P-ring protein FlgI
MRFQAIDGVLSPRDLIAIFEALKEAGALKAELYYHVEPAPGR